MIKTYSRGMTSQEVAAEELDEAMRPGDATAVAVPQLQR